MRVLLRTSVSCICLLLLVICGIQAQIETEERMVVAYGEDRSSAVAAGLVEAIKQVRGVEIEHLQETRWALSDVFLWSDDGDEFASGRLSDETLQKTRVQTGGVIDRYEIVKWNELANGHWEVIMRVFVAIHVPLSSGSGQTTLAIMPFVYQPSSGGPRLLDGRSIADQITQRLTAQAVATNSFRVLDRVYGAQWDLERDWLLSANVPTRELARLGSVVGADYLLVGRVTELHSKAEAYNWHGIEFVQLEGTLAVELRLIEFSSQQILVTYQTTLGFDHRGSQLPSIGYPGLPETVLLELIEETMSQSNRDFFDELRPIGILAVSGNQVYLDQGGARAAPGEEFAVLGPVQQVVHPVTSAIIDIEGPELARIVVTHTTTEYARGELVSGTIEDLYPGLFVRRAQ